MRGFVNPASYKISKAKAANYVNSGALLLGTGELSSSNDPGVCRPSSQERVRRLYGSLRLPAVAVKGLLSRRAQVHSTSILPVCINWHWT